MLKFYDTLNNRQVFIQYLNHLVADHYGVFYARKRVSPIDETLLEMNSLLGTILFACAGGYPFPEEEVCRHSMEAQRQLPPALEIYNKWIDTPMEGAVIDYCDTVDKLVVYNAMKKCPHTFVYLCPLSPRRAEIIERIFLNVQEDKRASKKIIKNIL